jgi:acylphosphatase
LTGEPETMALHLRIKGRVQGVFYRNWLIKEAEQRGVRGWVRNRTDGSVEAVLAGEMDAVRELAKLCHQGPPKAQVETVIHIPGEFRPVAEEDFPGGFRKLPNL